MEGTRILIKETASILTAHLKGFNFQGNRHDDDAGMWEPSNMHNMQRSCRTTGKWVLTFLLLHAQVLVYSTVRYDNKYLVPGLEEAVGKENVKAVRVSLSMETVDLVSG